MGIVSEPGGGEKGLVAANSKDTSGNRARTEGQGGPSEPPEGWWRHKEKAARNGRTHQVSHTGVGIASGAREADHVQTVLLTDGTARDVHAGHPVHQRRHRFG